MNIQIKKLDRIIQLNLVQSFDNQLLKDLINLTNHETIFERS